MFLVACFFVEVQSILCALLTDVERVGRLPIQYVMLDFDKEQNGDQK
jgi:hypothetical protein